MTRKQAKRVPTQIFHVEMENYSKIVESIKSGNPDNIEKDNQENDIVPKYSRDVTEPSEPPTFSEFKQLQSIILYPPVKNLSESERDLIFHYRKTIKYHSKALPKFILSTVLENEMERKEMEKMIEEWETIDVVTILELLSKNFTDTKIREFAVNKLSELPDDELIFYLLQLVQGMRYEESHQSPLVQFLINKAKKNKLFANYFYWYVWVERNDKNFQIFANIQQEFVKQCLESPLGKEILSVIERQEFLVQNLIEMIEKISSMKKSREKKIVFLKNQFEKGEQFNHLANFEDLPLPVDPMIIVNSILVDELHIYKSALNPIKISFQTLSNSNYKIIFKSGDDTRQDNLVIQLITLMDNLLKKENLDLKLTPYKVLPTSQKSGIVEFVNAKPLSFILAKYGKISEYFRSISPDDGSGFGFSPTLMNNYVKSCAGYSVITFLLGIGDRHFDNLLIAPDGRFLHIDFGYILGNDPKPYPPPMKVCKEMIDAMMGMRSSHYQYFKILSISAYNTLRKSAHLIINLLSLMIDCNLPDLARDSVGCILKVQEKFRLDLSEKEASEFISDVIDQSVRALFPIVVETIHQWAQYWRS